MKDVSNYIQHLDTDYLWEVLAESIIELKKRDAIKGNNIVGDRGENLAVTVYNETAGLPKLQLTPTSTKNIDAISVKGERYSIKTISYPNKTTGVFHGYG